MDRINALSLSVQKAIYELSLNPLRRLQGYLAHETPRPLGTLQQDYALGPTVVLGGGGFL